MQLTQAARKQLDDAQQDELLRWAAECERALGVTTAATLQLSSARTPGALGSTTRGQLWLDQGLFAAGADPARWRAALAHECCHLRQFELAAQGGPVARRSQLEQEAAEATAALMAGRGYDCTLAAAPHRCLHWNRFGHYYTVLVLMLHAGWPYHPAGQAAYMAQLPDLAFELDAPTMSLTGLALYIVRDRTPAQRVGFVRHFMDAAASAPLIGDLAVTAPYKVPSDWEHATHINIGLHSLTGRPIGDERAYRFMNLSSARYDSYEFGLALHAFGDSYAHCKGGSMYTPLLGHALDQHDPDCTALHVGAYQQYVSRVWDVVWEAPLRMGMTNAVDKPNYAFPRDLKDTSQAYKDKMFGIILKQLGMRARIMDNEQEIEQITNIGNFIRHNWRGFLQEFPSYSGSTFQQINSYYKTATLDQCLATATKWAHGAYPAERIAKLELEGPMLRRKLREKVPLPSWAPSEYKLLYEAFLGGP